MLITEQKFVNLEMETLTIKEIGDEMIECARYGELEDLKYILDNYKINVDYQDDNGNTALHKSCANGHLETVVELLKRGASINKQNINGNSPLHWAVTNKKKEIIRELLKDKRSPINGGADVLLKNNMNISVLTEVFNINDEDILQLVLEHSSADKLEEEYKDSLKFEDHSQSKAQISQEIIHELSFSNQMKDFSYEFIKCRELALMGVEEVFNENPQNDTTGVHLWSSSIVASYWMADLAKKQNIFNRKRILELGCGCGLIGIVATIYTRICNNSMPTQVYLTDVSDISLKNANFNIQLNYDLLGESKSIIKAKYLNWYDLESWLKVEDHDVNKSFDFIIGSDLVYNNNMENQLSYVISRLLSNNGTFYYVHRHDRLCSSKFKQALERYQFHCEESISPIEYTRNPLINQSQKISDSLFNELLDNDGFYLLIARRKT